MTRHPTRRALLLNGAAAFALTACSSDGLDGADEPTSSSPTPASPSSSTPPPSSSPSPSSTLPPVSAYAVLPGEVAPEAKEAAVRFLETSLTRGRERLTGPASPSSVVGSDAALAAPLTRMLPSSGPSAVRIVYPQYGGLTAERDLASVMITAEQTTLATAPGSSGGAALSRPFTVDVRLSSSSGSWVVTEVLPAEPSAATPVISVAARSVLDDARIRLHGDSAADLLSGVVDDLVLGSLSLLAQRWVLDVHVFSSGHPVNVFGTDKTSNHVLGLAVDVWALDGVPVIDHDRSAWREAMLAAAEAGATEVGGPEDLGPRPYFSDQVHQDHLHIGFGAA